MEILSVNNLGYYYKDGEDKRVIFDGVNVSFEEGRMYVLLGESGSGKTTFLSIIGGQDKRYTGTVKYMGKDIKNIGLDKYRRTAVSTIYQNYNLFTYLNSIENIELAMDISENVRKPNKQAIIRTLDKLGIDICLHREGEKDQVKDGIGEDRGGSRRKPELSSQDQNHRNGNGRLGKDQKDRIPDRSPDRIIEA